MQSTMPGLVSTATDLNNFVECRRLVELEALVAQGRLERPKVEDESAVLYREKGQAHEDRYLAQLEERFAGEIVRFPRAGSGAEAYRDAESRTLSAMRQGARIIYQATFFDGRFLGRADFLQRVETPSDLGAWSYEVVDAKLALSAKPHFIIQLCNYSEHLARLQGRMPERGSIVLGSGEQQHFKLHDYLAFYRRLKARYLEFVSVALDADASEPIDYPVPCAHCEICPWNERCSEKRVADDHLSIVAGMRRDQIAKLESAGIATVAAFAQAEERPSGFNPDTFAKLRKQAALQIQSRESGEPVWELLPHDPRVGFGLLPAPSPGDIYFDMEGDPMYEPGRSLEYLFGCWLPHDPEPFRAFWGPDRASEKEAFEQFIDFVIARRRSDPALHVYHYANYEKAALRRLSQEHGTRGDEVDDLLRGEVFVDLYTVVRQSMMIGEDSYSIKRFERFYGMTRATEVKKGDQSIVMFEQWRASRDAAILRDIADYNRDDCRSTFLLHEWILERRTEALAKFGLPDAFRPVKSPAEPCHAEPFEGCTKCMKRLAEERAEAKKTDLERRLLRGILTPQGDDEYLRMDESWRARYLLGHALSYHRREDLPVWWAYYDRCENLDQLREFDADAIGDLTYCEDVEPVKVGKNEKTSVYTYAFPEQRHKLDRGEVHDPVERKLAGTIVEIDDRARRLRIKRSGDVAAARALTALIPGGPLRTDAQQTSLQRVAESYEAGTLATRHPALFDLLTARAPRVSGFARLQPRVVTAASVSAVVQALAQSYCFIQGPPGSGKSTIGAEVIADLLAAGKRVGVMSTGHKAIHHLLHKVEENVRARGGTFRGLYKGSESGGSAFRSKLATPFIESTSSNADFEGAGYDLAGGTAWLFARDGLTDAFDYLFIDEAGQVSLANALAVAPCARNIVLLGDPSQLPQVNQGTHAPHAADSVLQHLLAGATTVPPDRGIFLDVSYRMHPAICRFISAAMYDDRLGSSEATARHCVTSEGFTGAGLRYLPVEHSGNSASSEEEAEVIVREILRLRAGTVIDRDGPERPMGDADIIVVTPYNAQRKLIARKLAEHGIDVPVGTVDKFQGQEAAVVFYSMATSSGDDLPRDLEFLFDPNRFNVAISRARALSVLVGSPRLLDLACRTAEQMALLNLVCSYVEFASGDGDEAG